MTIGPPRPGLLDVPGIDLFSAAVEACPTGMIVVATDGVIRVANSVAEGMFGYDPGTLVGVLVDELVPKHLRADHAKLRAGYGEAPTPRPMGQGRKLFGRRADGTGFPLEVGLRPVSSAGDRYIIAAVVDLTAIEASRHDLERANLELRLTNSDLEQFAHVASHDLKGPVRGISTLAAWIADELTDDASDAVRDHLDMLRGRVDRLARLLDGLSDYVRAGESEGDPELVNTTELVEEVIASIPIRHGLRVHVGDGLPDVVADRRKLELAFSHLIENAVRHHDKKTGEVWVDASRDSDGWRFTVADDGPGIESRHRSRVVRMFQTLKGPRSAGLGTGLAIAKRAVEAGGGTLLIKSIGRGSTFEFTVPDTASPPRVDEAGRPFTDESETP